MLSWKESLPLCFATNRVHYSRYGTYYVNSLEHIDSTHPGARQEIEHLGLSVRRNQLGIGQSIDMAGEQSYMRNAKTAGKVTSISNICFSLDNVHLRVSFRFQEESHSLLPEKTQSRSGS